MRQGDTQEPRWLIWVLLAVWIVFQAGMAVAWVTVDQTPPYWDEGCYLAQGAHQLKALRRGGLAAWYEAWIYGERIRPTLMASAVVPAFAALGVNRDAAALANIAAYVALLGGTYALGRALHGRRAGLLASLLLGLYPAVIGLAHIVLAEMLMMALVALTLVALWYADGFARWGPALLAGLLTGLGLLSKVFFPVFVAGPWLFSLCSALRPRSDAVPMRSRARNLILSLALAGGIAAAWYLPNLGFVLQRSVDAAVGAEATLYGPPQPWHWRNLLGYLLAFVGTTVSVAGALLLVAGIVGLLVPVRRHELEASREQHVGRAEVLFLSASALVGYVVFMGLRNQYQVHVVGILPALAVLSAWGLIRLMGGRWWLMMSLVAALAAAQTWLGTFPGDWQTRRSIIYVASRPLYLVYPARPRFEHTGNPAPSSTAWPLDALLAYAVQMAEPYRGSGRTVRIGTIPDYPGLDYCAVSFELERSGLPIHVQWATPEAFPYLDVLIGKTGDPGAPWRLPMVATITALLDGDQTEFQLMPRTFPLPEGGEALIYARRASPALSKPPSPSQPVQAVFGDVGRFAGYDAQVIHQEGQRTLSLTCYWEALGPSEADQSVFVHLLDPQSEAILLQDDHLLFEGIYPTSMWQPGRWLADARQIVIPPELSAPEALLRVGLYRGEHRLPVVSASTASAGPNWLDAGRIHLAP